MLSILLIAGQLVDIANFLNDRASRAISIEALDDLVQLIIAFLESR